MHSNPAVIQPIMSSIKRRESSMHTWASYISTECLYFILNDPDLVPMVVSFDHKRHHYLQNAKTGQILDVKGMDEAKPIPYMKGVIDPHFNRSPSHKARVVLKQIFSSGEIDHILIELPIPGHIKEEIENVH